MAKISFHKIDDMFEMVSWSSCEEKVFMELLIDFKENGKLNQHGLQGEAIIEITSQLSASLGKTIVVKKVAKKFKALRARYDLWKNVCNWPGVKLEAEGKFEASDITWDAIIKQYPYAKRYKHQCEPLWVRLNIIFGQLNRKEHCKKEAESIEEINKKIALPIVATMYDEDGYVKNEQSAIGRDYSHILPLSAPSVFYPSFGKKMDLLILCVRIGPDSMMMKCLNFHQLVRVWLHEVIWY